MYLIDSSIWIRILRRRSHPQLQERVAPLVVSGEAVFNQIVRTEVLVGALNEREYQRYSWQFDGLINLVLESATWDLAANIGFKLGRAGLPTGVPDLLIAASAIEHDAVLMHADSDFDRIARHTGLKVESYVDAV